MEANVLFLAENLMEQKAGFAHVNEVESSATLNWRSGENSLIHRFWQVGSPWLKASLGHQKKLFMKTVWVPTYSNMCSRYAPRGFNSKGGPHAIFHFSLIGKLNSDFNSS